MKNPFVWIIAMLCSATAMAQSFEPDFENQGVLLCINATDTIALPLDKALGKLNTKTDPTVWLPGGSLFSKTKSYAQFPGKKSSCTASKADKYAIVFRVEDNNKDPNDLLQIVKFEVKKKERRYKYGEISLIGGSSFGPTEHEPYTAKRYGNHSYIIEFTLEPGEYGIGQSLNWLQMNCFSIPE